MNGAGVDNEVPSAAGEGKRKSKVKSIEKGPTIKNKALPDPV